MNSSLSLNLAPRAAVPRIHSEEGGAMLISRSLQYAWAFSWLAGAAAAVQNYRVAASNVLIRSKDYLGCHRIDRKDARPSGRSPYGRVTSQMPERYSPEVFAVAAPVRRSGFSCRTTPDPRGKTPTGWPSGF